MERNDSVSLEVGNERSWGQGPGKERATSAVKRRLPVTPVEILRDLGMSKDAIAAYFRRFPNVHRS